MATAEPSLLNPFTAEPQPSVVQRIVDRFTFPAGVDLAAGVEALQPLPGARFRHAVLTQANKTRTRAKVQSRPEEIEDAILAIGGEQVVGAKVH